MPRLPPCPKLDWTQDGAPVSAELADVYFSGDGLSEKRAVFLGGCGLPQAWAGRERFCIGELGFGTGLSFLAAWELWRLHRPSPHARLDFLSFEGALISAADTARIHARWPEMAGLSQQLIARWPQRARGVQRIAFTDGVNLTLFIDGVAAALPEAEAQIDAWFLDGFAPSKNPEMWSAQTLAEIGRLSAPGARAATYTVAGDVRRGLEAAGFKVQKRPGIGRKKERLEAVLEPKAHPSALSREEEAGWREHEAEGRTAALNSEDARDAPPLDPSSPRKGAGVRRLSIAARIAPKTVLIIGAGVAGATAARAFLARGAQVSVIDAGPAPGAGASGNPLALVMPRLDAADGPAARGFIAAYLLARRTWLGLGAKAAAMLDAAHLPRSNRERERFVKLIADPPLDETLLGGLDAADPAAGLIHRDAVAVRPSYALSALLEGVRLGFGVKVVALSQSESEAAATLESGEAIAADLIVVCAGMGAANLPGLEAPPLEGRLGQIECLPMPGGERRDAIADGGYVVEAFGELVFGATFEPAPVGDPLVSDKARAQNLATLRRLRPDLAIDPAGLRSRAAIRATTPDRLPFAGAPPASQNKKAPVRGPAPSGRIRVIGGLGSRGFLWAPLLAELVASAAFDEPAPAERSIVEALDPGRFVRRQQRRGG